MGGRVLGFLGIALDWGGKVIGVWGNSIGLWREGYLSLGGMVLDCGGKGTGVWGKGIGL